MSPDPVAVQVSPTRVPPLAEPLHWVIVADQERSDTIACTRGTYRGRRLESVDLERASMESPIQAPGVDIDRLEGLAREATPGRWHRYQDLIGLIEIHPSPIDGPSCPYCIDRSGLDREQVERQSGVRNLTPKQDRSWTARLTDRDATYVAEACPEVVLGLIEEIRLLRRSAANLLQSQRVGGALGGRVRSAKLTPERRSELAALAARARWEKPKSG